MFLRHSEYPLRYISVIDYNIIHYNKKTYFVWLELFLETSFLAQNLVYLGKWSNCTLMSVCSAVVGWSSINIKKSWLMVVFKFITIFLMIFCLFELSGFESKCWYLWWKFQICLVYLLCYYSFITFHFC